MNSALCTALQSKRLLVRSLSLSLVFWRRDSLVWRFLEGFKHTSTSPQAVNLDRKIVLILRLYAMIFNLIPSTCRWNSTRHQKCINFFTFSCTFRTDENDRRIERMAVVFVGMLKKILKVRLWQHNSWHCISFEPHYHTTNALQAVTAGWC